MAEQLLSGTSIGSADSPSKIISWATYGIRSEWTSQFLYPACLQHADYLVSPNDEQAIATPEIDESDWDILFFGDDGGTMSETAIATRVSHLARNHALECIIVVLSDSSAELRNRFLMLGAVDVLHLEDSGQRIREGLQRAVDLLQARHCQAEKEKMSMVNRLAISVNHEINNPLTGLMGTTELMLRKKDQLDEDMGRHLMTIIEQCHRIREVTSRLKSLSHLRTIPYGEHDEMLDLDGDARKSGAIETVRPIGACVPLPSILVVDDNPLIVDLIMHLFSDRFDIEPAVSADAVLERVRIRAYDLVLIDLVLPEMNGLELYREIRSINREQRVVLMSAYQGDARVGQAINEGAAGCIFKPFSVDELEDVITALLKQSV